MGKLLLLFILIPTIELILLLQVGSLIGVLPTVTTIVLTGVLGAGLARQQGLGVLRALRAETAAGRLPAGPIGDGVLVLVAGALLMTPGFLTDLVGFLCLIPATRRLIKRAVWKRLERAAVDGRMIVITPSEGGEGGKGEGVG